MSARPDPRGGASAWIVRAEHDLINAEHTLTMGDDCPYDTVCFHAQQCVEKYLKGLLIFRGIDFPKVHDLRPLMELVPMDASFEITLAEVVGLNRFIVEARYPGDWEEITREDAADAVAVAYRVRAAVRAVLAAKPS